MSEWLLFNANSAIFYLYHNKLIFNEIMMMSALSVDRHVAPLRHIILIPSQPVFALSP